MDFLAELVGTIFIDLLIRFPVGLFKIWIDEGRKKSFLTIIKEKEVNEICLQGTISFLNVIAALGALDMFVLVIIGIIMIFRNGFTH